MVDEMMTAQRKWLPQYRFEIPAASKRLAAAKRRGDYRGTSKSKGTMGLGRIYSPPGQRPPARRG
jgi:hypothetical protein